MRKSLSAVALKKILETTNERDLFIVGHMYIENTIDRRGSVKKNVELLARIRNRYAHKLEPNEQRITNYIRELQYLGTSPKLDGKYAKYRVCAIRTFSALEKLLRR
jgi:hypothetical protein